MDLHAAISLYTHGVITKDELRQIASVYYKVSLGKTNTTPYINTPYIYQAPNTFPYQYPTVSSGVVTSGFSQPTNVTPAPTANFTTTFSRSQFEDTSKATAEAVGKASIDERPTKCACKH